MSKSTTRRLVVTALFAAAITVMTAYILHIPIPSGYIHIGDALIYLCASLLPLPYAMAAGAIGGGLSDLLTYPSWTLPTLIIKALIVLPFSRSGEKVLTKRNLMGTVVAGLVSPTLYGLVNVWFTGTWAGFVPQFVGTLIQGVGSGVVFVVLGLGLDKAGIKRRISF